MCRSSNGQPTRTRSTRSSCVVSTSARSWSISVSPACNHVVHEQLVICTLDFIVFLLFHIDLIRYNYVNE